MEDNYKGFIKNNNYKDYIKPTHKIKKLKCPVFNSSKKTKVKNELTFGSKIKILDRKSKFFKFEKGWVNKNNLIPIGSKEKNFFANIKIFKGVKYKWGGKSFKGIDCSGLVQICLNFNNKYCPRDAKDQIKYFKKNIRLNSIKKNDILFWKGHVAVALSKNKLIHAYGPMKKTVIMNIYKTIETIKKSANLNLLKIKRIN